MQLYCRRAGLHAYTRLQACMHTFTILVNVCTYGRRPAAPRRRRRGRARQSSGSSEWSTRPPIGRKQGLYCMASRHGPSG
eukprot:scaffold97655_cov63-Phaeocystis_antarctica.AAC.1